MCLDHVTNVGTNILEKKGVGWKVFTKDFYTGKLWPEIKVSSRNTPYPIGKWIRKDTRPGRCRTLFTNSLLYVYETGFHIFKTRKAARAWGDGEIRKVKYRGIICEGTQIDYDVVVANEILITETRG